MEAMVQFIGEAYVGNGEFLRTAVFSIEDEFDGEGPHPSETQALILTEGGRVFAAAYAHPIMEVRKTQALGTGGDVALGAMLAGKTPGEAVLIASRVDINTNGNVREVHIA
jgi:hypothetical protein